MIFNLIESHYRRALNIKKPRLDWFQALREIDEKDAIVKRLGWGVGNACMLRCGGQLYKIPSEGVGDTEITNEDMLANDYVVLRYYK